MSTISQMLWDRASASPDLFAFTYLRHGENAEATLTFAQLAQRSRDIACALQQVAQAGDRVLILANPGLDYIAAFFACSEAGMIAAPAYPPRDGRQFGRLNLIADNARPAAILTTSEVKATIDRWQGESAFAIGLRTIVVDELPEATAPFKPPSVGPSEIAFLQYTSGSTSAPKGVMVTHANILANIEQIATAFGGELGTRGLTWLPPYHDMGLIGCVLYPVARGYHVYVAPPTAIIQRPLRWLRAISDLRIEHTGGPDFAYDLCVRRISDDAMEGLDLSSWHLAFNGAEPVRWQTLSGFAEKFSQAGFNPAALRPCYGLAEATLAVSAAEFGENLSLDRTSNCDEREISCGAPLLQNLHVVDPVSGEECSAGEEGEIWVAGPNVAAGYWDDPSATAELFGAQLGSRPERYLRTGDLGRLIDGRLQVTGRIKELLVVRGVNYHPHDIEPIAVALDARCQAHGGAVFQIDDTGCVFFIQEVTRSALRTHDLDQLASRIAAAALEATGLALDEVVLVAPGQIPRTSSGKLQRLLLRELWLNGKLDVRGTSKRQQTVTAGANAAARPPETESAWALETAEWVGDYCQRRVNFKLMDERRTLQPHIILEFGRRGLLGLTAPREFGGQGSSTFDVLFLLKRLGAIDPTLALFTGLSNILGVHPIARFGTARHREDLLPMLATGRMLAAFALTEPSAGSNPLALAGQARPDRLGAWSLTGTKWFSGVAAWSGAITTFFRDTDPSGGAAVHAFCLPTDRQGIRQGGEAMTMGMRAMIQNEVIFEHVQTSREDLLGLPGQGLAVAQDAMGFGRLGIAAASIGAIQRSLDFAASYASRRQISSGLLLQNPLTRAALWRMKLAIESLNRLVFGLAILVDQGEAIAPEILAVAKVIASEEACDAVDRAVQILGGRGYLESEDLARFLRDVRVLRIFEGPTETLSAFVGAAVLASRAPILSLMQDLLQAPPIAARWQSALDEFAQAREANPDRDTDVMVVGEFTCSAVLAAGAYLTCTESALRKIDEALDHGIRRRAEMISAPSPAKIREITFHQSTLKTGNLHPGYEQWHSQLFTGVADEPNHHVIKNISAPNSNKQSNNVNLDSNLSASFCRKILDLIKVHSIPEIFSETGVGIADRSFTDLGLDSLDAAELTVQIEDEFGITLDPALLWSYPTPASLANYLAEQGRVDGSHHAIANEIVGTVASSDLSARLRQAARKG